MCIDMSIFYMCIKYQVLHICFLLSIYHDHKVGINHPHFIHKPTDAHKFFDQGYTGSKRQLWPLS